MKLTTLPLAAFLLAGLAWGQDKPLRVFIQPYSDSTTQEVINSFAAQVGSGSRYTVVTPQKDPATGFITFGRNDIGSMATLVPLPDIAVDITCIDITIGESHHKIGSACSLSISYHPFPVVGPMGDFTQEIDGSLISCEEPSACAEALFAHFVKQTQTEKLDGIRDSMFKSLQRYAKEQNTSGQP